MFWFMFCHTVSRKGWNWQRGILLSTFIHPNRVLQLSGLSAVSWGISRCSGWMRSIIPSESARSILWSRPSCLDDDGRKVLWRHSKQIPKQPSLAPLDAMKQSLSFELLPFPQLLAQLNEANSVRAPLSANSFHCHYRKLPENGDNWNIHRSEQLQTISSLLNSKLPWTMLK